jgi:uroporphyrinogen-III synthase
MAPLHGIGVLVTRPEQQATPLCRLLEAQGALTMRFPALEIKPNGDLSAFQARVGPVEAFDLIVFTSANAVRFGSALLGQRRDLTLAVIGPATARALNQAGYRIAVQPAAGFDSEALLESARLEHIAGQRILLIKGSEGRQLLEQEFIRRGAEVVSADVYERVPANPGAAQLAAVQSEIDGGRLHVVTATSEEIGSRLLGMLPAAGLHKLRWLVPGARVAAALRQRGLLAPLVTAASAEDQELVSALVRWRSDEPGA